MDGNQEEPSQEHFRETLDDDMPLRCSHNSHKSRCSGLNASFRLAEMAPGSKYIDVMGLLQVNRPYSCQSLDACVAAKMTKALCP